jgi:hypothetical protein
MKKNKKQRTRTTMDGVAGTPTNLHWFDNGGRYKVALGDSRFYDQGGYHTRVPVFIMDKKTGQLIKRVGDGRQMGNFHPVWVNMGGKQITVEKLLDIPRG